MKNLLYNLYMTNWYKCLFGETILHFWLFWFPGRRTISMSSYYASRPVTLLQMQFYRCCSCSFRSKRWLFFPTIHFPKVFLKRMTTKNTSMKLDLSIGHFNGGFPMKHPIFRPVFWPWPGRAPCAEFTCKMVSPGHSSLEPAWNPRNRIARPGNDYWWVKPKTDKYTVQVTLY